MKIVVRGTDKVEEDRKQRASGTLQIYACKCELIIAKRQNECFNSSRERRSSSHIRVFQRYRRSLIRIPSSLSFDLTSFYIHGSNALWRPLGYLRLTQGQYSSLRRPPCPLCPPCPCLLCLVLYAHLVFCALMSPWGKLRIGKKGNHSLARWDRSLNHQKQICGEPTDGRDGSTQLTERKVA